MKFKLLAALLLFSGYTKAQNLNIIPQPRAVVNGTGQFNFNNHSTIGVSDTSLLSLVGYFQKEITKAKDFTLPISSNEASSLIDLVLVNTPQTTGAYTLKITPERIIITSQNKEGIFYGLISLLQLVKDQPQGDGSNANLSACDITDSPRYQWRGL